MFYHLDPAAGVGKLVERLDVPVLDLEGAGAKWVESGTVVVVLLGWCWVVWKMVSGLKGRGGKGIEGKKKV